ncbi:unnamed protein product [Sphenostylis stenocarpa]|uniref:Pentatricopeptide repeat-containing protein n=1 Tax=Sphenostylis stenocarpa TaxID=92480 RepID=A0AA86SPV2_9FABA|nr:unnamed protein product [Sphenostylis stenocarpa]
MLGQDFSTWGSIVRSLCLDARHSDALSLFHRCLKGYEAFKPDYTVLAAILKSCCALLAPKLGTSLHSYVVKQGHVFCQVTNQGLLNMYIKSNKCDSDVMRVFKMMHSSGEAMPNSIFVATVLPVCARLGDLDAGLCVHGYVFKSGFQQDTLGGNALVLMYAKCGVVSRDAYAVFEDIVHKDVVSWSAMIAGLVENGLVEDAFLLFSSLVKGPTKSNYATVANILPVCASYDKSVAYRCGRQIHS